MNLQKLQMEVAKRDFRGEIDQEKIDPKVIDNLVWLGAEIGKLQSLAIHKKRAAGNIDPEFLGEIGKHLGDLLFFAAMLARGYGLSLDEIVKNNLRHVDKLIAAGKIPNSK